MTTPFVMTHPRNAVSAVRLGYPVYTSLISGSGHPINWGMSEYVGMGLNGDGKVAKTVNKFEYLVSLMDEGVSVPSVAAERSALGSGQWVIRPYSHSEGSDFQLLDGPLTVPNGKYAARFIHDTREYRVWFCGNDRFLTAKRVPRPSVNEEDESCRSKWGYAFRDNFPGAIMLVKKALAVVPLDFGAFDLLWSDRERKWYILEVNSAPSLDHATVLSFMKAGIAAMLPAERAVTPTTPAPRPTNTIPVVSSPSNLRAEVRQAMKEILSSL